MKMDKDIVATVSAAWQSSFARLKRGDFLASLENGSFTHAHYRAFLRETYYNVAMNPRIGCLFLSRWKGGYPVLEGRLLRHIASEVGHDNLALEDLAALGDDPEAVKSGRPLPATEALAAFVTFQIEHRHPFAYFGYIYHLEAIAEAIGGSSMRALAGLGIPAGALTFLKEHAENDPAHMRLNRDYLEGFVQSEADLEAVLYGVRGASELYGAMFQSISDSLAAPGTEDSWKPATAPAARVAKAGAGIARGNLHG